jgi:hypothetical protein
MTIIPKAVLRALPYTGFELPDVSGTLRFSLNAAEHFNFGYQTVGTNVANPANGTGTNGTSPSVSGSAAYLSSSPTHPFSMVYSGGYIGAQPNAPTHVVSSLALSQVVPAGRFHFTIADSLNYSPENPVTGLSGVPGLGDANGAPLPGSTTGEQIQTVQTTILSNRISGTTGFQLTARSSIFATAAQSVTRYLNVPGGSTSDSDGYSLSTGLSYQFDPYTTLGSNYVYSISNYLAGGLTEHSQSLSINATRRLTPYLSATFSAGPQFSSPSDGPSMVSYTLSGSLLYHNSFLNASVVDSRGVTDASGLLPGAESNSISGRVDRQLGAVAHASASVVYSTFSSVQAGADNTQSLVVSAQVNRQIVSRLSAYVSYTAQRQLNQGASISPLALNGTTQTIAFGVSYSSAAIHIGN